MIHLGLDFDNTITRLPEFFRVLSDGVRHSGGVVHLVSSRPNIEMARDLTLRELEVYGIHIDRFCFFRHSPEEMEGLCPHQHLDQEKKWLWQKIEYCQKESINIFFDDNEKTIELFEEFLPDVTVFKVPL